MDPETLNAMNDGMYSALLMLIEGLTLIIGLASTLFVILALVCAAFGAFAETRQPARRRLQPTPAPPEPNEYDLLAVLAALDNGLDDGLDDSLRLCGVANRLTTR